MMLSSPRCTDQITSRIVAAITLQLLAAVEECTMRPRIITACSITVIVGTGLRATHAGRARPGPD